MYHRVLEPIDGSATGPRGRTEAMGLAIVERALLSGDAQRVRRHGRVPVLLVRSAEGA